MLSVLSQAGTAYVTYENCIVPKKYLIGTENKGRIGQSLFIRILGKL